MARLARIVLVLLGVFAAAQAAAVERLTGDQIKQLFEGNTVSGRYSGSNLPFSEYHHADGRASGHNRHVTNTDACWITTPDAVTAASTTACWAGSCIMPSTVAATPDTGSDP